MTIDELKAKYAAMTPEEWEAYPQKLPYELRYSSKSGGVRPIRLQNENLVGIVALHNHFPALLARYEEAIRLLTDLREITHLGYQLRKDLNAALTNAAKPLEATT